jgi:hypothetical protein
MIKVDKGIPLPQQKGSGRRPKYPWLDMEIGDSFTVPPGTRKSLAGSGNRQARLAGLPHRFTQRIDNGEMRVWRIK